jgi:hypothetical protein
MTSIVADDAAVALMPVPACTLALTELMMACLQLVGSATNATGVVHVPAPSADMMPGLHFIMDDLVPQGSKPPVPSWLNEQTIDCMVMHQPGPLSTHFGNGVYLGSAFSSTTLALDEQVLTTLRSLPPSCWCGCECLRGGDFVVVALLQYFSWSVAESVISAAVQLFPVFFSAYFSFR